MLTATFPVLPSLLFAAAPDSGAMFTGQFVLTVCVLGGLLCGVLGVVFSSRRTPPVAEEMHRDFATRGELTGLRQDFDGKIVRLHERMEAMTREMHAANESSAIARGTIIGKLDGLKDAMDALREDTRERRGA